MKLHKITTAYFVNLDDKDNMEYIMRYTNGSGYLRLNHDRWYYLSSEGTVDNLVYDTYAKELEKEFQETVNVIHEQLPLL